MSRIILRQAKLRFIGNPIEYYLMDTDDEEIHLQYVSSGDSGIDPLVRAGFPCVTRYAILAIDRMDNKVKVVDMMAPVFREFFSKVPDPGAEDEYDYVVTMKVLWLDSLWLRIKDMTREGQKNGFSLKDYKTLKSLETAKLYPERTSLSFPQVMKLLEKRKIVGQRVIDAIKTVEQSARKDVKITPVRARP